MLHNVATHKGMSELNYHPGLIRRGDQFHYRRRVPKDIAASFGKREVWKSLRTCDRSKAVKLARRYAVKFDEMFDVHRGMLSKPHKVEELSHEAINRLAEYRFQEVVTDLENQMTESQEFVAKVAHIFVLDEVTVPSPPSEPISTGDVVTDFHSGRKYKQDLERWKSDEIERDYRYRRMIYADSKKDMECQIAKLKDIYTLRDFVRYHGTVDELLSKQRIELSKDLASYQHLTTAVLAAEIRAAEVTLRKYEGLADIELRSVDKIETDIRKEIGIDTGPLLSEEVQKWADDNLAGGIWTEKTCNAVVAALGRFEEYAGDRGIGSYEKADARGFRETLLKLPPNARQGIFKGLDIKQAVALAEDKQFKPMSRKTARKILGFIGAFFKYAAAAYDEVERSPFEGIYIRKEKNAMATRSKFSTGDLNIIFDAPLYTGCKSETCWWQAGTFDMRKTGRYWIALIGAFTGARLSEIVQLHISDIRRDGGIHFFDINGTGDKTLKTKASKRKIPIHPQLIEIGFLDYHKKQKEEGETRLFPEIKKSKADGTYSAVFSKWFSQFLIKTGVKDRHKVFHSFRHSFEDACRSADISGDKTDALQGHKLPGMRGEYGDGFKLEDLMEAINKIEYAGVDLSHLHHKQSGDE